MYEWIEWLYKQRARREEQDEEEDAVAAPAKTELGAHLTRDHTYTVHTFAEIMCTLAVSRDRKFKLVCKISAHLARRFAHLD